MLIFLEVLLKLTGLHEALHVGCLQEGLNFVEDLQEPTDSQLNSNKSDSVYYMLRTIAEVTHLRHLRSKTTTGSSHGIVECTEVLNMHVYL